MPRQLLVEPLLLVGARQLLVQTALAGGGAIIGAGGAVVGTLGTAAAIGGAVVGGFVGSVASQLVGKAIGAVDSFSLRNAFASGLTAGVTAGAGAALQAAGTVAGQAVSNSSKLTPLGRGIQAGTTAIGSYAANKLAGNKASFSWRNVAVSAVSAYAGSRAGLDSINPLDGGTTTGSIVNDTIRGIGHAGVAYGVGKLIQKGDDRPSWNFNQVAMDSFGNALGNAAVAGLRDAEETVARNKYIQEMDKIRSANAAKAANEGAQRATDESMRGIEKQQREKDTNKIMEAQGRITQGNNDAQFAAEEAKRAARSQTQAQMRMREVHKTALPFKT